MSIHPSAKIGENVEIGIGTVINENVEIGDNTVIGAYSIIGEYAGGYYKDGANYKGNTTIIGSNSIIRSHSIIYENVHIGDNFQSGHRITIRENTKIGVNCSVGTLCDLQGDQVIGDFVRLHSNVHIGQKSRIEDYVWIYPYVVLTNDPYPPMGVLKGVTVKKYAQIATSSVIMPGITIGENALIGASSMVNRDVEAEKVVVGVPGKPICSVRDLKNEKGEQIYPWKEFLKDFRGYPWQIKEDY